MLKGVRKNMIFVRLPAGSCFESACFVVRNDRGEKEPRQGEMVREANRIIDESGLSEAKERRKKGGGARGGFSFFLYGALTGMMSVAVAWLLTLIFA